MFLTLPFPSRAVADTTESMAAALAGAQSLVIAVGFVPGNPLKMNAVAHEVDNVGTCKLIVSAISSFDDGGLALVFDISHAYCR